MQIGRRELLAGIGTATLAGCGTSKAVTAPVPPGLPFANGERPLVAYPGKRPLLRLTARPPQLETPFPVFDEADLTPADAFFVRYHLADIPAEIDMAAYRLAVTGHVARPLSLTLEQVKAAAPPVDLVAVHQCSGNSRGFMTPRVGGGQLGHGAMGNGRWTGVPLRAVLAQAGIRDGAVAVTFDGLDAPLAPGTADFVKALDPDHAMDGEVMLAWALNGQELPFLNGFPLRLVVPGHFGTYWVKHLSRIAVRDTPFDGYWMQTGYRVPDNDCQCVPPGTKPDKTRPIERFVVRSFISSHANGAKVAAGRVALRGFAFDGGTGIARVLVSPDGGRSWLPARLAKESGRYAFRRWTLDVPLAAGTHELLVRAVARSGETQPLEARWNPPGYLYNAVERVRVVAA